MYRVSSQDNGINHQKAVMASSRQLKRPISSGKRCRQAAACAFPASTIYHCSEVSTGALGNLILFSPWALSFCLASLGHISLSRSFLFKDVNLLVASPSKRHVTRKRRANKTQISHSVRHNMRQFASQNASLSLTLIVVRQSRHSRSFPTRPLCLAPFLGSLSQCLITLVYYLAFSLLCRANRN